MRDLERLRVLPAAGREPNGYRAYGPRHVRAARAYRALGARTSALGHWEAEGLLVPERAGSLGARVYDAPAVATARVVAALRSAGYGIPALRTVVAALRGLGGTADAESALQQRLQRIAARSVALLRAGSDLAAVLDDAS